MIDKPAVLDDILNKLREWLCLVGLTCCNICDNACIKININFIAVFNLVSCLITFENWKSDIDRITIENPCKS